MFRVRADFRPSLLRFSVESHLYGSAIKILRSRRLFPVGPVTIASSSFEKKVNASLRRNASAGSSPIARARASVSPSPPPPPPTLSPPTPSAPPLHTPHF